MIVKQLLQLVKKIETGQKWEVMSYFYLLYDELSLLDERNLELILLYVLNVLSESCRDVKQLKIYSSKNLFSAFGTNLITDQLKIEFLKLCQDVLYWCQNQENYIYFNAYHQLINSVDPRRKEYIKEYILKNVPNAAEDFYEQYNDGDYLPF